MQWATFDNLHDPTAKLISPPNKLPGVSCVSHRHDQAHCVHHQMALASVHFLARIVAAWPPFSVVLTLWLSIIAALGAAWRPLSFRTCSRKTFITRSQVPSKRQQRA